ncbi:MAG: toxin-antitoxin system HicB family antitoxin, partial [Bacteroidota bacterium]
MTFESDNAPGLKKAFEESVDDYLAFCKEKGVKPDKTFKGSFNV